MRIVARIGVCCFAPVAVLVSGLLALPSLQAASISGIVSYSGRQTGTIWVAANTASNTWSTNYNASLTTTDFETAMVVTK